MTSALMCILRCLLSVLWCVLSFLSSLAHMTFGIWILPTLALRLPVTITLLVWLTLTIRFFSFVVELARFLLFQFVLVIHMHQRWSDLGFSDQRQFKYYKFITDKCIILYPVTPSSIHKDSHPQCVCYLWIEYPPYTTLHNLSIP